MRLEPCTRNSSPRSGGAVLGEGRASTRQPNIRRRRGGGWHSLRRKFASDLMHVPPKALCELGGWKSAHTVLTCYQHPDQAQLRAALSDRRSAATRI